MAGEKKRSSEVEQLFLFRRFALSHRTAEL